MTTYPYGMQGAPAVGKGLGGLPRREEAVAEVVSDAPQILERVGSVVVADTNVNAAEFSYPGRVLGDSAGRAVFRNTVINSGGNTLYKISGVNYTDSGVASALTSYSFSTTSGVWQNFLYHNSWSAGDSVYFYSVSDTNIYRIYVSGSNLAFTTAKIAPIPTNGTLTVSGSSYTLYDSFTSYVAGENYGSVALDVKKLSTGEVLVTRFATVNSSIWLVGFVLDTSFNIVRSFLIALAVAGTTSTGRTYLVLPVKGSTDVFSVFCISIASTAGSGRIAAATFSASTGSVSASASSSTFSLGSTTWGSGTVDVGLGFVRFVYNNASNSTNQVIFNVNNDLSVVNGATHTNTSLSNSFTNMPPLRYYDPVFEDMVTFLNRNNTTTFDNIFVLGSGTVSVPNPTSSVLQKVSVLDYTSSTATAKVATASVKGVIVTESDPSSSTSNTGAGPYAAVRVGQKSFVAAFEDQASATVRNLNTQLLKGV